MVSGMSAIAPLGPKQRAFVVEFVKDFQPNAAAKRAGYSPRSIGTTTNRLLDNPRVREAIQAEITASRDPMDEEMMVAILEETINRCRQAEPVLDRNGVPKLVKTPQGLLRAAYTFNAKGVYDGIRLLGTQKGLFAGDPTKVSVDVEVRIRRFSDEEEDEPKHVNGKLIDQDPRITQQKDMPHGDP